VFGGAVRMVLRRQEDPEAWLREKVPRHDVALLSGMLLDSEGSQTPGADIQSRLVHLYPPDVDEDAMSPSPRCLYARKVARFASPKVKVALFTNMTTAQKQKVAARLMVADVHKDGATVALLFEPLMHAYLKGGLMFRHAHADADDTTARVMPAPPRSELFGANTTLASAVEKVDVYMEPRSKSFASIDSFIRLSDNRVLLFQMTGQASHPINMPGIKRLFEVGSEVEGAVEYKEGSAVRYVLVPSNTTLVFVLMPNRLKSFKIP
jgi:hypothetical protein